MAKAPSRREQRYLEQKARKRRMVLLGVGALVLVLLGGLALLLADGGGGDDKVVASLTLDEYTIEGDLEIPAGDIRLEAVNVGAIPHNVGVRGGAISAELRSGEEGSVDIGELGPGTYELYCDVLGHEAQGMVATLTVTDA
ncbi:MAG: cupredoxin domain-containing protein [Acidimicrobiia bacterium]|nr:cupredoxin domain-containing protein [Acidimicrobiia bacterium]